MRKKISGRMAAKRKPKSVWRTFLFERGRMKAA